MKRGGVVPDFTSNKHGLQEVLWNQEHLSSGVQRANPSDQVLT
jgi:hypothetical protein